MPDEIVYGDDGTPFRISYSVRHGDPRPQSSLPSGPIAGTSLDAFTTDPSRERDSSLSRTGPRIVRSSRSRFGTIVHEISNTGYTYRENQITYQIDPVTGRRIGPIAHTPIPNAVRTEDYVTSRGSVYGTRRGRAGFLRLPTLSLSGLMRIPGSSRIATGPGPFHSSTPAGQLAWTYGFNAADYIITESINFLSGPEEDFATNPGEGGQIDVYIRNSTGGFSTFDGPVMSIPMTAVREEEIRRLAHAIPGATFTHECNTAPNLALNTTYTNLIFTEVFEGHRVNDDDRHWRRFYMPDQIYSFPLYVSWTFTNGSANHAITVYQGACASLTAIFTSTANSGCRGITYRGQPLLFLVSDDRGSVMAYDLRISLDPCVTNNTPGEDCASAVTITQGISYGAFTLTTGQEHWFKVTHAGGLFRVNISTTTTGSLGQANVIVYTGECEDLTSVASMDMSTTGPKCGAEGDESPQDLYVKVIPGTFADLTYTMTFNTGACS